MVSAQKAGKAFGWTFALVVLVGITGGCNYNGHTNFANAEKWAVSDVHWAPKVFAMPVVSVVDAVFSPFTMFVDQAFRDRYAPEHKYFSYAASRTIGRSDMTGEWQWLASVITIPIETVWLPLTGLVDLGWILFATPSEPPAKHDMASIRNELAEARD